jgi:nicotinamide-nucleotide amidase
MMMSVPLFFCLVDKALVNPHLRELTKRYPLVEAAAHPACGTLKVVLHSSDQSQLAAFQKELISRFRSYCYVSLNGKIEEALHDWFVTHHKTLAFAESCTGGMLSMHVTSIPGSSDYFLGSFVVYSNTLKQHILGVSPKTLDSEGAVSESVVKEMLNGVFQKTSADFGLAVSGIAGPSGGTPQKPVGTICAAIGERGKIPDVGTFQSFGDRQGITLLTTQWLLGALWRKVENGIPAFPLLSS